jgi:hypothetical protein
MTISCMELTYTPPDIFALWLLRKHINSFVTLPYFLQCILQATEGMYCAGWRVKFSYITVAHDVIPVTIFVLRAAAETAQLVLR